ncbi:MAG: hypothetical protein Q7V88_12905 [Actinomycetota bacterium]|nr:hypothetical protein [Actinomycetota bacterium]
MRSMRATAAAVVLAAMLVSATACSDGDGGAAAATSAPTTPAPIATDATTTVPGSPAPEPTGVPGLADPDPFCAAWAAYSGTLQSIGIAEAFGQLVSSDIAWLELVAAPAITDAADGIEAAWPGELAEERSVVLADYIGPFRRRAEKALAALAAAGVTDDGLAQLRQAWFAALAARNPDEPVITVPPLAAELDAMVRAAAAQFDAAVTPFADDPSLFVDSVEVPLTDIYLANRCPDLASSGVGDAV